MKANNLLTNREFFVEKDWFASVRHLLKHKSVIEAKFFDTTSSAGDWDGLIVQKLKYGLRSWYYIIPFCQENNYPRNGYTVRTGNVFCRLDNCPTENELENIYWTMFEHGI